MSAHREPGWVALLAAVLRDTPRLDGCGCQGRWALYDAAEAHEDQEHVEYRHHQAVTICNGCEALNLCRAWIDELPPNRRPSGVVAGRLPKSERTAA